MMTSESPLAIAAASSWFLAVARGRTSSGKSADVFIDESSLPIRSFSAATPCSFINPPHGRQLVASLRLYRSYTSTGWTLRAMRIGCWRAGSFMELAETAGRTDAAIPAVRKPRRLTGHVVHVEAQQPPLLGFMSADLLFGYSVRIFSQKPLERLGPVPEPQV